MQPSAASFGFFQRGTMTHAVELKNITKRFGSVTANDKVDLYVDSGVIMSLV